MIGEKILLENGARLSRGMLMIPRQEPKTQEPELFKLSDFTKWWNPDWILERAGYGGGTEGFQGFVATLTSMVRLLRFGRAMRFVGPSCVAPSSLATRLRSHLM